MKLTQPVHTALLSPAERVVQEAIQVGKLIDKCFQLSLLDKNLVKRKYKEGDPELTDIIKRYLGKSTSAGRVESLGLQVELKKYLTNLRPTQTRQIKLVTEKRFRLPLNYQRSTIDLHKRLSDRELSSKRAPSAGIEHPRMESGVKTDRQKRKAQTLFESIKGKLSFKNSPRDNLITVAFTETNKNSKRTRSDDDMATNICTTSKQTAQRFSNQVNQLHTTPPRISTIFSPPNAFKLQSNQRNQQLDLSSINEKQPSGGDSFRIFPDLQPDVVVEISQSSNWSVKEEMLPLLSKLRQSYAEEIVCMFFGRGRRTILKTQFLMTLQSFFEFIRFEVRLSSMSQLTDTLFKGNTSLTPSMLGIFLESFCPLKESRTRTIFNAMNPLNNPTVKLSDLYMFFDRFSAADSFQLKQLFDNEKLLCGPFVDPTERLTYWDLYLMEDSRCWNHLWKILTMHPLL